MAGVFFCVRRAKAPMMPSANTVAITSTSAAACPRLFQAPSRQVRPREGFRLLSPPCPDRCTYPNQCQTDSRAAANPYPIGGRRSSKDQTAQERAVMVKWNKIGQPSQPCQRSCKGPNRKSERQTAAHDSWRCTECHGQNQCCKTSDCNRRHAAQRH